MMNKIDGFFSFKNAPNVVFEDQERQQKSYLQAIMAFARTTYSSIYVIDYQKKGFEYVSENPLFLCGYTAEEVKAMGYIFFDKCVMEEDVDLLLKINTIGFDFFESIPVEDRGLYTISYDYHLKNTDNKSILVNQKLTPLFLTSKGKIWKAICVVSSSNKKNSGNIKIHKKGDDKIVAYDLPGGFWKTIQKIKLSEREKEILRLSVRGYTIKAIAKIIFVSPETVKFHRKKIFRKLGVANIVEAIACATNDMLI